VEVFEMPAARVDDLRNGERLARHRLDVEVEADVAREARASERAAPGAIARCCATTSRASPSPPSAVSLAEVASPF
jgi:hypothetical protein